VRLTENFRSREPIVEHSRYVIVHNEPARFAKDLFTLRSGGSDVLLIYEHSVVCMRRFAQRAMKMGCRGLSPVI
jgi:superfamily I DNA/RNA helicase